MAGRRRHPPGARAESWAALYAAAGQDPPTEPDWRALGTPAQTGTPVPCWCYGP
ncbi:hypothetical protein WIS52_19255 [Pseudonocardia nematodicida]|uniref:Uncharacterized protein n=1 Tax=Pseudonocardia nematodicida TaxID=1206997 RepID=A0ABV1KDS0_9PSEU